MPVEGLRSSSMMKRYLRAKNVARVEGISVWGYVVGEKSGCHPLGKMLSKSSSFSEFSCKGRVGVTWVEEKAKQGISRVFNVHVCGFYFKLTSSGLEAGQMTWFSLPRNQARRTFLEMRYSSFMSR